MPRRSTTPSLAAKGFGPELLAKLEAMLPTAFDIKYVMNRYSVGDDFLTETLGLSQAQIEDPAFDLLRSLGFSP